MTKEAQRLAIAKFEGFRRIGMIEGHDKLMGDLPPCRGWIEIPDYLNDLSAMHEVEKTLSVQQQDVYGRAVAELAIGYEFTEDGFSPNGWGYFSVTHATAAQRAEAFLRAKGLWVEEGVEVSG